MRPTMYLSPVGRRRGGAYQSRYKRKKTVKVVTPVKIVAVSASTSSKVKFGFLFDTSSRRSRNELPSDGACDFSSSICTGRKNAIYSFDRNVCPFGTLLCISLWSIECTHFGEQLSPEFIVSAQASGVFRAIPDEINVIYWLQNTLRHNANATVRRHRDACDHPPASHQSHIPSARTGSSFVFGRDAWMRSNRR